MAKRKSHTSKVGRHGAKSYFKKGAKKRKYSFDLEIGSDVIFEFKSAILLGSVKSKLADSKYIVVPKDGGSNEIPVTWQNHPCPVNDVEITSTNDIEIGDTVLVQHSLDTNFIVLVPSTIVEIYVNNVWVKPDDEHSRLCIKAPLHNVYWPRREYKLNTNLDTNIPPSDINIIKLVLQTTQAELLNITKVRDDVRQQLEVHSKFNVKLKQRVTELEELYRQSCMTITALQNQLLTSHQTSHQMVTLQATLLQKDDELSTNQKQLISSQAEVADLRLQVKTQSLELKRLSQQLKEERTSHEEQVASLQAAHEEQVASLQAAHEEHVASLKETHNQQMASEKAKHLEVRPTPNPNLIEARPSGQTKRMSTYMRLEVPESSNPSSDASTKSLARRAKQLEEVRMFSLKSLVYSPSPPFTSLLF